MFTNYYTILFAGSIAISFSKSHTVVKLHNFIFLFNISNYGQIVLKALLKGYFCGVIIILNKYIQYIYSWIL